VLPIQGDSERLPFAAAEFDVVTCSNSFHHYPHQDRAVAEMRRVLRPGGCLFLVDGYRDAPWGWFIYDVCVATVEGHVHHCSRQRVRALCEAAGFATIGQQVHRGAAPFLLTEAVTPPSVVPAPHFSLETMAQGSRVEEFKG
jgi:ubiquinone/menaquinone biosynthesis C-methylase UbiE